MEHNDPKTDPVITIPDPFDPSLFRADTTLDTTDIGITLVMTHIRVGKPKASMFFRAHPDEDFRMPINVIEDDSGGMKETYLVTPKVASVMPGDVKPKLLVLCVDKMGTSFLWPAPRLADDGNSRSNLWNETALKALLQAETVWTRMQADTYSGAYKVYTADYDDPPQWSNLSMNELIKLGFGEDKVIRDVDHPVIRRLLGRA
jgi:hypothetical protein